MIALERLYETPAVVAAGSAEDSGTQQYLLQRITLLKRQLEEERSQQKIPPWC
jgi:hypothetical protein